VFHLLGTACLVCLFTYLIGCSFAVQLFELFVYYSLCDEYLILYVMNTHEDFSVILWIVSLFCNCFLCWAEGFYFDAITCVKSCTYIWSNWSPTKNKGLLLEAFSLSFPAAISNFHVL
jgi:hypothetical protein